MQVRRTGERIDTRPGAAYLGYNGSHYFYRSDIHLPELRNYLLPSLPLPASIPLTLQSTCKNSWMRQTRILPRPSASPNFSLKLRAIRHIYIGHSRALTLYKSYKKYTFDSFTSPFVSNDVWINFFRESPMANLKQISFGYLFVCLSVQIFF